MHDVIVKSNDGPRHLLGNSECGDWARSFYPLVRPFGCHGSSLGVLDVTPSGMPANEKHVPSNGVSVCSSRNQLLWSFDSVTVATDLLARILSIVPSMSLCLFPSQHHRRYQSS
jgi:hypothetical protein